jgi:tight adherence protein C
MQGASGYGTGIIVAVIALAAGLSAALIVWMFSRAISDVPAEDREYKDPPPLAYRATWWLVQWIGHVCGELVPRRTQAVLLLRLRKAGLDYCLSPAQFIASRILCAACVAGLMFWGLRVLSHRYGGFALSTYAEVLLIAALAGWAYPAIWLHDRVAARKRELLKTLPFFLDIVTLCVEAGLNMQAAIAQAVAKGPKGVLRDEMQRLMRDIRAGKGRAGALRDLSTRLAEPGITHFTTAVIQAESMGMNLGPVLRAQADQRRSERFLRAEKLAMEAPVKMLFPLIAFIFPCTFLVLFFPIVMKFMHADI